jgi:hypothetical protein
MKIIQLEKETLKMIKLKMANIMTMMRSQFLEI